jgi:hypothetical protein
LLVITLIYSSLLDVINKTPTHDIIVMMGDFNAKIGDDNKGIERCVGKHGMGTMNQNGERLLELCELTNMVISSTFFPHKNIHKSTWISPDNHTKNQIDHFCINSKIRTSVLDVRAYRGAVLAAITVYAFAKIRTKLKVVYQPPKAKKIDSNHLLLTINQNSYNIGIQNKLNASSTSSENAVENLENHWHLFKNAITNSAAETAGYLKKETRNG